MITNTLLLIAVQIAMEIFLIPLRIATIIFFNPVNKNLIVATNTLTIPSVTFFTIVHIVLKELMINCPIVLTITTILPSVERNMPEIIDKYPLNTCFTPSHKSLKSPVNKPLNILITPRMTLSPPWTISRKLVNTLMTICLIPPNIIPKKAFIPDNIGLITPLNSELKIEPTAILIVVNTMIIKSPFCFQNVLKKAPIIVDVVFMKLTKSL